MKLKLAPLDTIEAIQRGANIMTPMFSDLKDEPDPFALVSEYRRNIEDVLKHLDERMCAIMTNQSDRVMWAVRMGSCQRMMRALTMNLAVYGKTECDWNEIGQAMAFLRAVTEGAELTLSMNEPEVAESTITP